jgi:class 3 adenylate cyclase
VEGSKVEHRFAVILCADVVGYSRLMGIDEEGTLAALRAVRRDLVDPKIAEHRGRIVRTMGDGLLVEFNSVVDVVRCAIRSVLEEEPAVQSSIAWRRAAAPSTGRRPGPASEAQWTPKRSSQPNTLLAAN